MMIKSILLTIFAATLSAVAMDEQQLPKPQDMSGSKKSYVVDYEELVAKNASNDEIADIHHAEDARLVALMGDLRAAIMKLKRPIESEIEGLIRQALSRVQAEQDDNSHRWSESFTRHRSASSSEPPTNNSSSTIVETLNKNISQ